MPYLFIVLFIVFLLPILLAGIGHYLRYKQFEKFDNNYPRLQQLHMTGMGSRVMAAQQNAWEALILFSSASLLAYMSGVDLYQVNYAAILFLLSRLAHALFYIFDMAIYRTAVFIIAWGCCVDIALQAFWA